MKKTLLYTLLLCSGLAQAFDGAPVFTTRDDGAEHTLTLSHWTHDRQGIPSFDYVYVQRRGTCQFRLAGHLSGITVQNHGKTELEVYNGERADGTESQTVMFDDGTVTVNLPYKGKLRDVGLNAMLKADQRKQLCTRKHEETLTVYF